MPAHVHNCDDFENPPIDRTPQEVAPDPGASSRSEPDVEPRRTGSYER